MNLIDYGRILLRRGWIILLLAVIAAGSAYLLTSRQTPEYTASQRVLIQPARTDNGLTLAVIQLMNSYQVYLDSSERAQEVIDAAVQMHGGMGVTRGAKVEELYREIRALRIYEGASEVQRQIIARDMLKEHRT